MQVPSGGPPAPPAPPSDGGSGSVVGAAVGGAVGGVVALLLAVGLFVYITRRRKARAADYAAATGSKKGDMFSANPAFDEVRQLCVRWPCCALLRTVHLPVLPVLRRRARATSCPRP